MSKFHKKFAFRVEIDGLELAAFRTATPLQLNVANIQEFEGGGLAPTNEMGRVTYDNITLSHGVTDNEDLWSWAKDAVEGKDDAADRDIAVIQTDRAGNEIKRWNVFSCKPVRFLAGEWDNTADENTMEELELSVESFEKA